MFFGMLFRARAVDAHLGIAGCLSHSPSSSWEAEGICAARFFHFPVNGMEDIPGADSTFGGVKATTFSVDSDIQITATVPTGAKTGKIAVTTPGGTAVSKDAFTVTQ